MINGYFVCIDLFCGTIEFNFNLLQERTRSNYVCNMYVDKRTEAKAKRNMLIYSLFFYAGMVMCVNLWIVFILTQYVSLVLFQTT